MPHPFEEELGWVVLTNHRLLVERISGIEAQEVALGNLPPTEIHFLSDELRRAANNLALVGLVTRLHHWVSVFVEELTGESARDIPLAKNLDTLNKRTGVGPVPVDFFRSLVDVRDAIIHADSRRQWTYRGKKRRVSERYASAASGDVNFTETHLQEAIEKSVMQVKWYDDQVDALQGDRVSPH